jgi:TonB family protein
MRRLAVILCVAAASTAAAVGQWTTVATTAEVSREAGAARWISWTESATRERCAPPDSAVTEGTDQDFFNCLLHTLQVRNEAAVPMQCRLSLDLTAPNYKGHASEFADVVVFPEGRRWVSSMGPTTSLIKSHAASCLAIPAEPAPLILAAGCQAEVKAREIDDYYPRGAIRLQKEGTVQVEYSTVTGRQWTRDVQVVRSSGVESLDEAALRYMRSQRVNSNCPGQRFRYDVVFKLTEIMRHMYQPRIDH